MSNTIEIYGATITLPELPKEEEIVNYDLPLKEQKWSRKELPSFFDKVEYNKDKDFVLIAPRKTFFLMFKNAGFNKDDFKGEIYIKFSIIRDNEYLLKQYKKVEK